MSGGEMLRLRAAARRFSVSVDTLRRWADAGLVGRGGVGRVVFVSAADIERLIAPQYATPKRMAPANTRVSAPASEDWRNDPLWRGRFR